MVTLERLKELLDYCPETGVFRWRNSGKGVKASKDRVAGCLSESCRGMVYVKIRVDRKLYYAHRLAWLYMTSEMPKKEIDHQNRNGLDNRFCNLRIATSSNNKANRASRSSNPYKGITKRGKKWIAQIHKKGTPYQCLGVFSTPEEAAVAYDAAAVVVHGEFAATNKSLGLL